MNYILYMRSSLSHGFYILALILLVTAENHQDVGRSRLSQEYALSAEGRNTDLTHGSLLKRGINSCACCASKQLFFCCSDCMRQTAVQTPPASPQISPDLSKNLAALVNGLCACCQRSGNGPFRVERRCCQQCLVLRDIIA